MADFGRMEVRAGSTSLKKDEEQSGVAQQLAPVIDFSIGCSARLVPRYWSTGLPRSGKIRGRSLAATIPRGLLLGYGARVAYGCKLPPLQFHTSTSLALSMCPANVSDIRPQIT
jgi:hypothetical protein